MTRGTAPEGIQGDRQVSSWVRDMFGRVAPRYDLLNHVLSLNVDKYWRSKTVRLLQAPLARSNAVTVDLCCGTGDLTIALEGASEGRVFGTDFCHPMLTSAQDKVHGRRLRIPLFEADSLQLPLRDASVDIVTAAFGFRNLVDYDAGLAEMRRVLRPGGVAAILEFSHPPQPVVAALYGFYSTRVLPRIAALVSGAPSAYKYLPESVRKFPGAEDLAERMEVAGFSAVTFHRMTFGAVALHCGRVL